MSNPSAKSFPERMDNLARLTGVPGMVEAMSDEARPRHHLRWLSLSALALATSGLVLALAMPHRSMLGYSVVVTANGLAGLLPLFGPVKPWGTAKGVDERDRQLRRDAYFVAFATISAVAVVGLFILVGLTLMSHWDVWTQAIEMAVLAFYLISLWSTVPTLHASWATRPIEDE